MTTKPVAVESDPLNIGEPIHIPELLIDAVVGNDALEGQKVHAITKLAISSAAADFHPIMEGLAAIIDPLTQRSLYRAEHVLIVIKQDRSAKVWIDNVPFAISVLVKRAVDVGSPIADVDIVDVQALSFPGINIEPTDKVIVVFQIKWRYGLYFDLGRSKPLDVEQMSLNLGRLYRSIAYQTRYLLMHDIENSNKLLLRGWFPFVEISHNEFAELARYARLDGDMDAAEEMLLTKFDRSRMEQFLTRWNSKPSFAKKPAIFTSGIAAFIRADPVSSIKVMITEIEGILNSEHDNKHGKRLRKLPPLIDFAIAAGETKFRGSDGLLFPQEFKEYLQKHTFANFDPSVSADGEASSRHAVGHGAADPESYTMVRALQVILTLDQLLFYF